MLDACTSPACRQAGKPNRSKMGIVDIPYWKLAQRVLLGMLDGACLPAGRDIRWRMDQILQNSSDDSRLEEIKFFNWAGTF